MTDDEKDTLINEIFTPEVLDGYRFSMFENKIRKKNQKELGILLEYAKANNVNHFLISKIEFTIDCFSDRK